ncbi:DUF6377 domain-containing protein [Parapedobacter koreensis]|uniref:DUF6377 domain-containing protein n=1 Tax=Parapedobacter koreensis TaxID=332977 RepID=A0A1H7PTN4_9SPHI|nr:DUF6377 domain-containing protein [Parapedobacter koreensis]SEL38936.1 hypothetical protein SAMN05421740_1056 [Parapedobacter koreensis]
MKPRPALFLLLLIALAAAYPAKAADSILMQLQQVMRNRELYETIKENKIAALKQQHVLHGGQDFAKQYEINLQLIEAYKKYKADSAIFYAKQNQQIAETLDNPLFKDETAIQLAWLYSSGGLYIESEELLEGIDRTSLAVRLLPDYYETYLSFCSHYGQSNGNNTYYQKSEQYRDSLLTVLDTASLKYHITAATRVLYQGHQKQAEEMLLALLEQTDDRHPERALITYLLGVISKNEGNIDRQLHYFALSAITDMINAIKDNASLQSLALTFYDMGDIAQAYQYMEAAVNDAIFCNMRYRTVESTTYYPIINASFRTLEQEQKAKLRLSLILISLLSVGLIMGIVYSYLQMKRLAKTRKALYDTNQQLSQLNQALQKANDNLFEANHIKEEYIAHFFDICSANIEKLEDYRKSLHKKAVNNQYDALLKELKSTDLAENELVELYHNFDTIFLNLYPTFVSEFNGLLLADEHILPKPGELLNTELRIFALVRLGITDSVKIASFLRYSLRTVYNYRTKIRHKAAASREEFEAQVRQIGTLRQIS